MMRRIIPEKGAAFTPRAWGLLFAAAACATRGAYYLPAVGDTRYPPGLAFLVGHVPIWVVSTLWLTAGTVAAASILLGKLTAVPHFAVVLLFAGWGAGYAIGAVALTGPAAASATANALFFGYIAGMTLALIKTPPPLALPRWALRRRGE